jgi:excisionase family DNA binding protein
MDKYLKVPQIAAVLNVSPKTVWNWIALHKLSVMRFGRSVRVPDSELRRLEEEGSDPARRP